MGEHDIKGLVFGPVISRRLGVSLGINNIPYKKCTYSCIYCQLGKTIELTIERRPFYNPKVIINSVEEALSRSKRVDHVTFVPNGEPTLDVNLGREIILLKKQLNVRIAVLTNASLLWREDVRLELYNADVVSLKIDASQRLTWRKINRPHPKLGFQEVVAGLKYFANEYSGVLLTESMLIKGINDNVEELVGIAEIIASLNPHKAYLAIPTRPPAEPWVKDASAKALTTLYKELEDRGVKAELLISGEPPPPQPGDPIEFIKSTIQVHPLKIEYVIRILENAHVSVEEALCLLTSIPGIEIVRYRGVDFLVKRPSKK